MMASAPSCLAAWISVGGGGDAGGDTVLGAAHRADRLQHGDGSVVGGGFVFRGAGGLRHVGGETAGGQAAPLHLRQIDTAAAVLERVRAGGPGDVDVRVDGQQAAMQREGVGLYGVIHDT